ncbi:hypothetical protein [Parasporobacterium paucivorans]|uniref:hypothetical protein n=1 Tax=Parasporobacterium paucivorans TaxID=115544 RepID=UPI0009396FF0|nr:hypothetical protein [Parasporobacterium paucivorans]
MSLLCRLFSNFRHDNRHFIRIYLTTNILGPHGDPQFEIKWENDIEKGFAPKFKKDTGDSKNAEIACIFFSSSSIGLYKYFLFKNPTMTNKGLSTMLGKTLKYSLFDFWENVRFQTVI